MNSGHFKTIFSKRLGCLVVVGEHASSQGKANGAASGQFAGFTGSDGLNTFLRFIGTLTASFALVSLAWSGPAASVALGALPTGGQVAQGAASISTTTVPAGSVMNIHQSTARAVLNWNTFDIGQNAKVNIVQPSANAVMLNRVTSANPSQILGKLNANGQVVLVNPNGVLFGKDGSVNASSFTASTLGITDANFMAGNQQFERNGSTAGVVNQGEIKTTGGYVALLGATVSNEGKIQTQGGTAYLAAAETVKIPVSGSGRIKLELTPSRINAAVANTKGGTIVTEGGQVYMQAAALNDVVASIFQNGAIDTTGEKGGAVHLLADGGVIKVDGSITANSSGTDEKGERFKGADIIVGRDQETAVLAKSADVSGARFESEKGFVETSGEHLTSEGVRVTAGLWLLDPFDVTISSAATTAGMGGPTPFTNGSLTTNSNVSGADIQSAISGGTSVWIWSSGGTITSNYTTATPLTLTNNSNTDAALILDTAGGAVNAGGFTGVSGAGKSGKVSFETKGASTITVSNAINMNGSISLTGTAVGGSGAMQSGTGVTVNSSLAGIFSGIISGAGGLTKSGAGLTALTGANTYSGITTIGAGSTLQIGDAGTAGTLGTGNVVNSGILSINRTDAIGTPFVLSNSITGAGSLLQSGTGTTKLMGANSTFTGGITISKGAVIIGNAGITVANYNKASGVGAITMGDSNTGSSNIALYLDRGFGPSPVQTGLANEIMATNNGTGTLTIGGLTTTTSGPGWTIYSGKLTLARDIIFHDATGDRTSYDGLIQGVGNITLTGNRQILGSGVQNTFRGNYTVNAGSVLQLAATAGLALNTTNNLINNGEVRIFFGGQMAINSLSGSGAINTYSAGSSVSVGNNGGSGIYSGTINGSGGNALKLIKNGSGTQVLSGANNYSGTTTINAGTLQIGNNGATGTLGSGAVLLSGGSNLTFLRTASTAIGNSISGAGNVSASISGATSNLTVSGAINLTDGKVDLAADGNVSVTSSVATTNRTNSAVIINAGKNVAAGTGAGGNLTFTGSGTVSVGAGGRATLFSGTVAGSTGLTALVGSGSGRFRYGSDEATTNYSSSAATLGSGLYAIYREAPTISIIVNSATKTYDGQAYSGSAGISSSGFQNGDSSANALGAITYGGGINANGSPYTLSATAASNLGYSVSVTNGTLTINKAVLTLSGTKVYDSDKKFAGANLTATGVNGETFSVTGAGNTSNLASKNVQTGSVLNSITGLSLGSSANGGLSSNYEAMSAAGSSVNVTARSATYSATAATSTYSGLAQTQASTKSGFVVGDALTFAGEASGTNFGTYGSTLSVTGADAGNYNVTLSNANLQINKAALTLSGSKVYDADKKFAGANLTATGVHGETFTITGTGNVTNLASKNVQTGSVLNSVTDLALGTSANGGLSSNYEALSTAGSSVNVTAKAATLTGNATTVTYNGVAQTQSAATIGGVIVGDVVTASGLATGTNFGTYASSLTAGGVDAGNYTFTATNANLVINKAALALSGSKVYDGDKTFAGSNLVATGVNGETFSITGIGNTNNLASKNVQTGSTLNTIAGLTLGTSANGGLSSNYEAMTAAGSSVSVTARSATYSATATTSTYSGLAQTQASTKLGFVVGDALTFAGEASGTNFGTYGSTLSVTGADAANYNISLTNANLQINKAALALSGSKVYDGDKTFAGSNLVATGVNGETFSITGAGNANNLASKNVQTGSTLNSIAGLTLGTSTNGGLSSNYEAMTAAGSSVNVTARSATYSATATTSTYSGLEQTQASTKSGFVVGDVLTFAGEASGTNFGTYASSLSVTGADAGNYNVTLSNANLQINKAALTLSGSKVYDADKKFAGANLTATGVNGETFTITGTGNVTNLASKNVQTGSVLNSVTDLALGTSANGGLSSNYEALSTAGSSVNVTAKAATLTGNATTVTYNGTGQTQSAATIGGVIVGDVVTASGLATGTNFGNYASSLTAGGADAGNYTFTTTNANLQINKAALALSGSKVYDADKRFAGANLTATGVNGETFTVGGAGDTTNLTSKNVQSGSTLNSITGLFLGTSGNGGLSANYEALTAFGSSVSVTPKAATLTGNATTVTYNGAAQTQSAATIGGVIVGDVVTASGLATGTNFGTYASRLTAGGADAGNYTFTTTNANLVINKAALALSGSKVYDGDTKFAGTNLTATGVNGEMFSVGGAGDIMNLASKNVQTNQALSSVTGLTLGTSGNGGLSANYEALTAFGSSVSVAPKAATLTGNATTVTYSGAAQTQSAATIGGVIVGDVVIASGLANGTNFGTYTSSLTAGGADAGNYTFTTTNADLVINKAPLTVTAGAVTKVYDGQLTADGSGTVGALAGAAAGDVVNSGGDQAFLNKDAGTGKSVRASGVTIKDASNADKTANYQITYVDNTASVITKAALTIRARDDARFVTQADAASFDGAYPVGLVNGETTAVLGGTLTVSRTNAAGDVTAGTYNNVLVPAGLTSNNYEISFVNGSYTIVPANQLLIKTENVSAFYGTTPSYNTTAQYLLDDEINPSQIVNLTRTGTSNNYTFSDGVGGSVSTSLKPYTGSVLAPTSLSLNTVVGSYSVKDTSPVVTGGNFVGAPVFTGTLTVNTKSVTPSASTPSKVYDGTTSMAGVTVAMTGKVAGDDLSIGGTGAFTQKNVGTSLGYTISGVALSGADSGNYHLGGGVTSFSGSDGAITAAPLVITTNSVTKTYDRLNTAAGSAVVTSGTQLFTTDSMTGGTFGFTDVNAGAGNKTVAVSGVTINDGNGGANYSVTYQNNITSTITPKALTATFTAANKVYNGGLEATVSAGSGDIIAGDVVSISSTGATFDTKHVGTGKTVSISGVSIGGTASGNYDLQNTNATASANITPKALTANFTGNKKVYDGTVDATVTGTSADKIAGDALTYSTTTATFDNKNVGTGKPIDVTGISLGGADAGNYALQNTTATATGTITAKELTFAAVTDSKTYDGSTSSSKSAAVTGTQTGDTITAVQAFASKNVLGTDGSTLQVSAVTINDGNDGKNYSIGNKATAVGTITAKELTFAAVTDSKVYDGGTNSSKSATVNGTQTGDTITAVQAFASKNVLGTDGSTLNVGAVTISDGNEGKNYSIGNKATAAGTITAKELTLAAVTDTKVYNGGTSSINSATVTGTQIGDSITATQVFASKNVLGTDGSILQVGAVTINDGNEGKNYSIGNKATAKGTITPKQISITGSVAQDKTVDGNTNAKVNPGLLLNLVQGESLVVTATGQFSDASVGTNKPVTTQYALSNGSNGIASNYVLSNQVLRAAILAASINPVQPIVNPARIPASGRMVVAGSGSSGAALVVADGPEEVISREECSVLNPEKCECQESTIAGVEMCFAPTLSANTQN